MGHEFVPDNMGMTRAEWNQCDRAWWVNKGSLYTVAVRFDQKGEPRGEHRYGTEIINGTCDAVHTSWSYSERYGHWFATEAEARFYAEVLR